MATNATLFQQNEELAANFVLASGLMFALACYMKAQNQKNINCILIRCTLLQTGMLQTTGFLQIKVKSLKCSKFTNIYLALVVHC